MKRIILFTSYFLIFYAITFPQITTAQANEIQTKTSNMKKFSGYFTFYWDEKEGKIWLEIDKWDTEFLYVNHLSHGIGSNDIGLDRGQMGKNSIVKFYRAGPKVLLIQPNYGFRSSSLNKAENRAVKESFAQSVLGGFNVEVEENNRVLVDASKFFLRDARNVVGALKRTNQGNYKLSTDRNGFYLPNTNSFPNNTEVEVILTFVGEPKGSFVRDVVPSPEAITVHQGHTFIQLPKPGYQPRVFDPRSGYFGMSYKDFSSPINEPIVKRFISRHRLEKKNPDATKSEPVKPIIYYVDPGIPEPILSVVIEGAKWWNEAFEAAGFINGFQVEVLPEDADPLDIRYNIIKWVHRSTRGWSYGGGVIDPRTGEIIKGQVTLGSLRIRQDYLIASGLLAPYDSASHLSKAVEKMALDRIRQLSAHEVGHTLGLTHNFASSAMNRESIMDYPHPLIKIKNGKIDLSEAYTHKIGEWDKIAITYGYQDFPDGAKDKKMLDKILSNSIAQSFILISDQDARPAGGSHPTGHLWDNGKNAVDELNRIMQVREIAINHFSEKNIRLGDPMANLENVLVPVYLLHRYQVEAAAKSIGGMYYTYAVRGDGQRITEIVAPAEQRRALEELLNTLQPKTLAIPERILNMIPPQPLGYGRDRENFKNRTGVTFDPLSAAEVSANLTLGLILHHERAARLIEYHARDNKYPGLIEIIVKLINATWNSTYDNSYYTEIKRVVDNLVVHHLILLAVNKNASSQVKAIAYFKLNELKTWLIKKGKKERDPNQKSHFMFAFSQINQFQKDPNSYKIYKPVSSPAGAPIGMEYIGF